ncbi:MAG: GTP cyclohydrolase II [Euryarchaeota archaeon]|nr:GTP cyclohydrolase II [Euryarchaeota archaeon]|tara:strand:+ start:16657 stop:17295 length:639 start_codon:yes stop_codon:yes gene_type:complete
MNSKKVRIQETGEIPADARLPTDKGEFRIRVFNDSETGMDHVALTLGEMKGPDPVLVRVHSECLTGDAFGSLRCDCGPQLDAAISMIQDVGWGCILYLRQEGRGIGLHAKIQAYNLQDQGADTVEANLLLGHPADARDYGVASEILRLIGIESVCLLTNNPDKIAQLISYGINVEQRMPLVAGVGDENREYLAIKVDKMGHDITTEELNGPT